VWGPEIMRHIGVSSQWFNLITGALLIGQLIVTPDGMVTDFQHKLKHLLGRRRPTPPAEVDLTEPSEPVPAEVGS